MKGKLSKTGNAIVTRALQEQHRTARALNTLMEQLVREEPRLLTMHEKEIAHRYPKLVKLMERAARAQLKAVRATTKYGRRLAGLALPAAINAEALVETTALCEVCRCGWLTPCAGGCSWLPQYWKANRAVCSSCGDRAKPRIKAA